MPKHEATISLNGTDKEKALAISYQAMKNLEWNIQYAGDDILQCNTRKTLSGKGQEIVVRIDGDTLSVSSEMVNGESFDLAKKNRKNTTAFIAAFEAVKLSTGNSVIENNKNAISELRISTQNTAEEQLRQVAEIDKVMNLSGSNIYATYAIIGINVLIFILMVLNGAGLITPDGLVHIKWGSNFSALTLTGDWWRLITNIFIHFGIIHLLMNMYCLYTIGIYLEPMLGKARYISAYLCTGVLASIVSLWWHKDGVNSAGASGAIFGLYGLFLALLTTQLIPKQMRQPLLQSIGIFIAYNLFYGMKSGVDNSAHVGGLLSGFVIGYLYAFSIKKEKEGTGPIKWVMPAVVVITVAIAAGFLNSNVAPSKRTAILNEIKATGYKDSEKFNEKFEELGNLETKALAPFNDSLDNEQLQKKLVEDSSPLWDKAETVGQEMLAMDMSPEMHKKAEAIVEYVILRKKEIVIITDLVVNKSPTGVDQLNEIRNKINTVAEKLK